MICIGGGYVRLKGDLYWGWLSEAKGWFVLGVAK